MKTSFQTRLLCRIRHKTLGFFRGMVIFMNILTFALSAAATGGEQVVVVKSSIPTVFHMICRHFGIYNTQTAGILCAACIFVCMITAYLIGSINPAIIFSKLLYHEDIRTFGSGNAGTTNTLRTYGKKMAILIFSLDLLKAALAIAIGSFLLTRNIGGAVSALFVILGHMFPIYYKFKGGKGVACAAMCILLLSPIPFLILITLFIVIVACFRYISLGSIMCAMLFPFLNHVFYPLNGWITLSAFCIGALIVFMHRQNIGRLLEGKESKLSFKKTDKHAASAHNGVAATDVKVNEPEKECSDDDFVKCSCGRLIPVSREKCAYCGAINKDFVPKSTFDNDKNEKKKD